MSLYRYALINEEARDVRVVMVAAKAEWAAYNDLLDILPEIEEVAGHELEVAEVEEVTLH